MKLYPFRSVRCGAATEMVAPNKFETKFGKDVPMTQTLPN